MNKISIVELQDVSRKLRSEIIDIAASDVGCHLGGSLSAIDLMNTCFHAFSFADKDE